MQRFLLVLFCLWSAVGGLMAQEAIGKADLPADATLLQMALIGGKDLVMVYARQETGLVSFVTNYYLSWNGQPGTALEAEPSLYLAPDAATLVWTVSVNGATQCWVNNRMVGSWDEIGSVTFSADSRNWGYPVRSDTVWWYLAGDKKFGPFLTCPEGREGAQLLIYGTTADGSMVFAGDKVLGPFNRLRWAWYQSDGKTVTSIARQGAQTGLFRDKDLIAAWDDIGFRIDQLDNDRFAYTAFLNDRLYLIFGDQKLGPFDSMNLGMDASETYHVSKDRKTISYAYKLGGAWYVQSQNRQFGPFSTIYSFEAATNEDLIVSAQKDNQYYVILGTQQYGPFDSKCEGAYSPDGKLSAWTITEQGKQYLKVGREKAGPYDFIHRIVFSPDNRALVFVAWVDKLHYLVSGKQKYGPFKDLTVPAFLAGNQLVYGAQTEAGWYVCVGQTRFGPYASLSAAEGFWGTDAIDISPDQRLATTEVKIGDFWSPRLYIDGAEYPGQLQGGVALYLKNGQGWRLRCE